MPADLKNPFGPSCCDGGACNTRESAQPCGCDLGINHLCDRHAFKQKAMDLINKWRIYNQKDMGTVGDLLDELESIL